MQYEYIQRIGLMRFRDSITLHSITLNKNRPMLVIISCSNCGKNDLGVNKARIHLWIVDF